MADSFDLAIVGGGPAGQAAALALQGIGLSIVIFDEQQRPGGQILRQPPRDISVRSWLAAGSYRQLKETLAAFEALKPNWRGGRSVVGVLPAEKGFIVHASGAAGGERVAAERVLIAGGCQDIAAPMPGWTLPGVMAAGGIQAFAKSQQLVPGDAVALAGTHPLMLLIAEQILDAGGRVVEIAFAQPRKIMLKAFAGQPFAAAAGAGNLAVAAAAYLRLVRRRVPISFGARPHAAIGARSVEAVEFEGGRVLSCDALGLCFGFVPQSDLVRSSGAAVERCGGAGGWAALADRWMQSSVPGLYVAGETTGVAGAPAALTGGTLAGLGIAIAAGAISAAEAERRSTPVRQRRERLLRFAKLLDQVANPSRYWPQLTADTILCRCEDVPLAELESALSFTATANGAKLISRCGMGVCQGRNCEPTLLRLLAARGRTDDPGFTARFPARPVPIGDLVG